MLFDVWLLVDDEEFVVVLFVFSCLLVIEFGIEKVSVLDFLILEFDVVELVFELFMMFELVLLEEVIVFKVYDLYVGNEMLFEELVGGLFCVVLIGVMLDSCVFVVEFLCWFL